FYGYTSSNGNFIYEKTEPSPLALEGDIGASVWLSGSNMMPGQSESGSSILSDPYSLNVKLDFTNDQVPSVESVTAPAGTYYAGQTVPVTVTFSEPVTSGSATING